jgi:hypothetical protein
LRALLFLSFPFLICWPALRRADMRNLL